MRASAAVGLLLVSSASIFGLHACAARAAHQIPGPEPVWVNGVMGVYNPDTHVFVPCTSPLFDQTCDLIQQRRDDAAGSNYYYTGTGHHWTYSPGLHYFSYPSGGSTGSSFWGRSSSSSFSGGSSFSSGSSERGGIGATGHGHGGGE